jgi:hypothetical protein
VAFSLLKVTLLGILPRFAVKFRAFTVCNYLKPPFWDFLQTLNGNIHISNRPPSLVLDNCLNSQRPQRPRQTNKILHHHLKKYSQFVFNGCMKHLFPPGVTALAALACANFPLERKQFFLSVSPSDLRNQSRERTDLLNSGPNCINLTLNLSNYLITFHYFLSDYSATNLFNRILRR